MMIESPPFPTYQRRSATFDTIFGAPPAPALAAMNEANDDPVNLPPRVALDIRSVGYTREGILVRVRDPFGSAAPASAICTVTIGCEVCRTRRGVHMSRLGDVLARSVLPEYADVFGYARDLARAASRSQYGGPVSVTLRSSIPYVENTPLERGSRPKVSLEHLVLLAKVRLDQHGRSCDETESGIRFTHLVACPCVQRTYAYARAASRAPVPPGEQRRPALTHTQRCSTTVVVRGAEAPLPVGDFLSVLDTVVVRTMDTLPRGSELAMVYRAHASPQFIEDALRETLWALYRTLPVPRMFTSLRGSARSQESIHGFDLAASAVLTPEDARRCENALAAV